MISANIMEEAVAIKVNICPHVFLKRVGVSEDILNFFKNVCWLKFGETTKQLEIIVKEDSGSISKAYTVPVSECDVISSGIGGLPVSKQLTIRNDVAAIYNKIRLDLYGIGGLAENSGVCEHPGPGVLEEIGLSLSSCLVFPVDDMYTSKLIPLRASKKLYQPVLGTTSNSRYYTIAVSKFLNLAVQLKDASVSIRAEGDLLGLEDKSLLLLCGFEYKTDLHASMHCLVNSRSMFRRLVGAVIAAVNVNPVSFYSPHVDFSVFKYPYNWSY